MSSSWQTEGSVLYRLGNVPEQKGDTFLINALDMDGTVIKPQGVNVQSPWTWLYPNTVERIKQISDAGWHTVIFTNRGDAKSEKMKELTRQKIDKVIAGLGIPVDVFVATAKDDNRKPDDGMFKLFLKLRAKDKTKYAGYMIGDAEGSDSPYPEYRRSNDDKGFAGKTGLVFMRPIEYYTGVDKYKK